MHKNVLACLPLPTHAAESRVDVGIVGLEPVSKGAPQHASVGARRAALHDVMLAVEKISGVTLVERERLESGERLEWRRGPFPSVGEQPVQSEFAAAPRKRIDGRRIPSREVEVSVLGSGRIFTPGERSLAAT